MQVFVLVHCRQIVENALQFVLFRTVTDHDELLEKQQDVRSDGENVFLCRSWPVQAFRHDAALGARIDHPIIELERVYGLQNGADASYVAVNLGVGQKFSGQVRVEACLNVGRRVDPKGRVEEHMIEQLPCEK